MDMFENSGSVSIVITENFHNITEFLGDKDVTIQQANFMSEDI